MGIVQLEDAGQARHRVRVGEAPHAALEVCDGSGTQSGLLGQFLLCQPGSCTVVPKQRPETVLLFHSCHRSVTLTGRLTPQREDNTADTGPGCPTAATRVRDGVRQPVRTSVCKLRAAWPGPASAC
jgi:hypothetical protein